MDDDQESFSDISGKLAYKRKKNRRRHSNNSSSHSDSSVSPPLLPENATKNSDHSDDSLISEHLNSNSGDSVENDCSYQEIEISNVPSNSSFPHNSSEEEVENVQHILDPGFVDNPTAISNAQGILDEILQSSAFKFGSEHTDSNESFNLFEGVSLNDSLINDRCDIKPNRKNSFIKDASLLLCDTESARVKQLEGLLNSKEDAIAALTIELESLRELTSSNQSTLSLNTSTTDYKLYHEDFQNKIVEYQNALVYRDTIIQQLTEALQQSVVNREQLQEQSERFGREIVELKQQLAETSSIINQQKLDMPVSENKKALIDCGIQTGKIMSGVAESSADIFTNSDLNGGLEEQCSLLEETLNLSQIDLLNKLRKCINVYLDQKITEYRSAHQNEIKTMENKLENERVQYESELVKLRDLLASLQCDQADIVAVRQELDAKHAQELEELRTYFEKKCADLEKHYSEEVFSQQTRKNSDSSSTSEISDFMCSGSLPIHGAGGDNDLFRIESSKIEKINYSSITKDDLVKLKAALNKINHDLDKYQIENISKQDLHDLKIELEKHGLANLLKFDIAALKNEVQNKYHAELEILREDYENRIDALNVENNNRMQSLEKRYVDQIDSLKFELDEALNGTSANVNPAIQEVMLVANTAEDAEWPSELLQLRSRFTEKYEKQINELEEKHQQEMVKLKSELLNNNNGSDLVKERDDLKKTAHMLRYLIGELMNYFNECENELNNTLVEELLKQGFDKNLTDLEVELNLNESSNSTCSDSASNSKKRVHFTPRFDELLATIDSSVPSSLDSNISIELKNELGACLSRLRSDANAILALSTTLNKSEQVQVEDVSVLRDRISSLTNQLVVENQVKKDLAEELNEAKNYVQNLEAERVNLENHIEQLIAKQKILEADLQSANIKITQLIENGHKEVISEGYGDNRNSDNKTPTLSELQERVKGMAVELGISAEHPFLQLIEELCRQCERINEEAKYNHEDLQQQVEQLEQKMRQMSNLIEHNDKRLNEVELEKKEAIDKIFFLREIIRGLESEVETRTETETKLRDSIVQLKDIIQQQNKINEELGQRLGLLTSTSEAQQYQEHIDHLEDEVQRLRINTEFVGSEGALKQIKTQLNEFEMSIDKCTRDLEILHSTVCTTTCSSPSEDVSIRDQIKPQSPSVLEECDIPLQQLARLKEKLIKHSRAEDAAVKRIRDLEMELSGFRRDLNEVQNERDLLQDQVSEQLVLISSLQMRLDDQRLRAEQVQKQTNTSLEVRIYDLENEVKDLMEILNSKDKSIKQLNKIIDETRTKLQLLEQEVNAKEDYKIIEKLRAENASLLAKINNDAQNAKVLPNLVDNILTDKNKDIDILRKKLEKTETELNLYQSLNLDHEQLKALSHLQRSDRAFSDILSLIDVDTRKVNNTCESLNASYELPHNKPNQNETVLGPPELSSIERIGEFKNIHYSMEAPLTKPNSTEIKSAEKKKVRFEDSNELVQLRNEIQEKDEIINDYEERFKVLTRLESTIDELRLKLDSTEKALVDATETFEKEQLVLKEVRVELAEKKLHLDEKEKQLEGYIQDAARKDQMYLALAKEKRQVEIALQNQTAAVQKMEGLERDLSEKQIDLDKLNNELVLLQNVNSQLQQQNEANAKFSKDLKNIEARCETLNEEIAGLKQVIEDKNIQIEQLQSSLQLQSTLENKIKELNNVVVDRETEIEILNEDANRYQEDLAKMENKIKNLKSTCNNEFEIKMAQSARDIAARNLQIEKLKAEIGECNRSLNHANDLIAEKERIIKQMTEDSKSLHVNLETIQTKLQETGNVVDLKKRLEDEQCLNKELQEELHRLRSDLDYTVKPVDMTTSIEEITGAVCKQLDYSATLDSNILNAVGVCDLEELLEQEKAKCAHLQKVLEQQQTEDADMMEKLRLRLELALKNETEFDKLLQQERQARFALEQHLQKIQNLNKGDSVEYRSLPNLNVQDVIRLTKEVQTLLEENAKLKNEIRNLKSGRVEAGANLKYAKDMLQLRNEEIDKLEKQIEDSRLTEANTKEALIMCKAELDQKLREIENSRILMGELEQEGRDMKKEVNELRKLLKQNAEKENIPKGNMQEQMTQQVPAEFINRMKELTAVSQSVIRDNKKMSKIVKKLADEKNLLQQRILELQNAENDNLPFDDPVVRANYLFAKYLRADSYRKALVFQKKYLIELLASYQAHPALPHELKTLSNHGRRKFLSFRIVTTSVIAVIRMQYLVQRWHSGKRNCRQPLQPKTSAATFHIGQPVSSQNFPSKPTPCSSTITNNPIPNFLQTSGATCQSADDEVRSPSPVDLGPWSGGTPPTKEALKKRSTADYQRDGKQLAGEYAPLQAPQMLSQYVERFDQIQQRLGATIEKYS